MTENGTDHPDWDDLTLSEKVRAAVGSGLVSAGYLAFPSKFDESLQRQEFEYAADELGAEIRYVDTETDGNGGGFAMAENGVEHIHFITETDPSPTLRCRIFGHRNMTGTAREEPHREGGFEIEVCRRCKSIKGRTWDGIALFLPDSGRNNQSRSTETDQSDG